MGGNQPVCPVLLANEREEFAKARISMLMYYKKRRLWGVYCFGGGVSGFGWERSSGMFESVVSAEMRVFARFSGHQPSTIGV
jgi:hypothetical protein